MSPLFLSSNFALFETDKMVDVSHTRGESLKNKITAISDIITAIRKRIYVMCIVYTTDID